MTFSSIVGEMRASGLTALALVVEVSGYLPEFSSLGVLLVSKLLGLCVLPGLCRAGGQSTGVGGHLQSLPPGSSGAATLGHPPWVWSSCPGGVRIPSEFVGILKGILLGLPCWVLKLPVRPREPCLEEVCPRGLMALGRLSGTGAQGVLLGEASVEELCRVRELPLSAVLVIIWVRTLPGPSTGGVGGLSPE